MNERAYCKHPDRHVPGIVCGHPLPCPYHTVIVDETGEVPVINMPITINKKQLKRIKDIANILKDD